jgi:DNA primase
LSPVPITRAFLEELRRRVRLSDWIGRELELARRGREFVGLCPFHHEKTPSFTVRDDLGFFHCFGCSAHGDVIEFIRRREQLDFPMAVARLVGALAGRIPDADCATPPSPTGVNRRAAGERERMIGIARRLWDGAGDLRGTLGEKYLRVRGLDPPFSPVLRFAPRCWNRETGRELPAILARIDGPDGSFIAVHRLWLSHDGRKADLREPKWSLGSTSGGAVRLAPVGAELAIAEGIENALTIITATGMPAWSVVSKGGFKGAALPAAVRAVLIVADNDANGHGQAAARSAGERWAAEGRRVRFVVPERTGENINDVLRRGLGGWKRTSAI